VTIEREISGPQQIEDVRNEKIYLEGILRRGSCLRTAVGQLALTHRKARHGAQEIYSDYRRCCIRTALTQTRQSLRLPGQLGGAVRTAGCGGRGTHVATSFSQNTAAQVTALADLFQNQLDAAARTSIRLNANLSRQPIDGKLLFGSARV